MRGSGSWRRRGAWSIGDTFIALVATGVLVWALAPGIGLDLLGLGRHLARAGGLEDLPDTVLVSALRALPETPPDEVPSYDRDRFGQQWADTDRNGCDTRNDILARDLARAIVKPGTNGCVVLSGTLAEPYTGTVVDFVRGQDTSGLVQIDHVVALANAWRSGAWAWDLGRRQEFANDPMNLLAVDGQENQDKEAQAADTWLPPDGHFACDYVARQVAVKAKWGLTVTELERRAMAGVLAGCPDEELPTS